MPFENFCEAATATHTHFVFVKTAVAFTRAAALVGSDLGVFKLYNIGAHGCSSHYVKQVDNNLYRQFSTKLSSTKFSRTNANRSIVNQCISRLGFFPVDYFTIGKITDEKQNYSLETANSPAITRRGV